MKNLEFLTAHEVMKLLKISRATLWRYERRNLLKSINLSSRKKIFPAADVYRLLEKPPTSK